MNSLNRKQKVSCNYLDESNLKYPYIFEIPLEVLDSKMSNNLIEFYDSQTIQVMQLELNNLEKRNVSFLRGITHNSKTRHVNEVLYNT